MDNNQKFVFPSIFHYLFFIIYSIFHKSCLVNNNVVFLLYLVFLNSTVNIFNFFITTINTIRTKSIYSIRIFFKLFTYDAIEIQFFHPRYTREKLYIFYKFLLILSLCLIIISIIILWPFSISWFLAFADLFDSLSF